MDVGDLLRVWRTSRDPAVAARIVELSPQAELVVAFEDAPRAVLSDFLIEEGTNDASDAELAAAKRHMAKIFPRLELG